MMVNRLAQADLLSFYPQRSDTFPSPMWLQAEALTHLALRPLLRYPQRLQQFIAQVESDGVSLQSQSDPELAVEIDGVRSGLIKKDFSDSSVARSFALVREYAGRRLGMRHFEVQLAAGWMMLNNMIAEMQTGEGKTLAATLAAATAALAGLPVHVVTVNDYLATRDAEQMRPLYQALGLSVSAACEHMSAEQRRLAYQAQITYCTPKQLAFDYLRDRIALGQDKNPLGYQLQQATRQQGSELFLRGLYFAIIDEADSVLIDESRTPLIIAQSHPQPERQQIYAQALQLADQLQLGQDFQIVHHPRHLSLTEAGRVRLSQLTEPLSGIWRGRRRREHLLIQALTARNLFHRDHQYLVLDGKVKIIDEFSGRIKQDSSWQQELQQMIECKEACALTGQNEPIARISLQRFFRRYLKLGGMSGTVREVRRELSLTYTLDSMSVPSRLPSRRNQLPLKLFATTEAKVSALIERVRQLHAQGLPVLVATRSVADSDHLSERFHAHGLAHQLLNARQDRHEAERVAQAGGRGQITIATQMAGRGTDIRLAAGVAELGGLHVLLTDASDARRIDRQIAGRCARQGEPGVVETWLSLEDELMRLYYPQALLDFVRSRLIKEDGFAPQWLIAFLRYAAQRAVERQHYRLRQWVLLEDQRLQTVLAFAGISE